MSTRQTMSKPNRREILKRNTKINVRIVTAHERLERKPEKLGVEIKPSFNIEPPLGRNRSAFHNRNV